MDKALILRKLKIKEAYLEAIHDLLIDYDGCKSEKGLKELIDEAREWTVRAIKNDDETIFSVNGKRKLNILGEEIENGDIQELKRDDFFKWDEYSDGYDDEEFVGVEKATEILMKKINEIIRSLKNV